MIIFLQCLLLIFVKSAPRNGFMVGKYFNASDIINDGITQERWIVDAVDPIVFSEYSPWLNLWMWLSDTANPDAPTEYDIVPVQPSSSLNLTVFNSHGIATKGKYILAKCTFTCHVTETVQVSLTIFLSGYTPVDIYFQKKCVANEQRWGFMVGTHAYPYGDVVLNGLPTEDWDNDLTNGKQVFGSEIDPQLIFLVYTNSSEQPFSIKSVDVDYSDDVSVDFRYLQLPVAHNLIDPSPPASFEIFVECTRSIGTFAWITIVIDVSPFQPISINFGKQCSLPSHGWTSFGVFIFVLLLLLLSFCISGCIYKNKVLHFKGWNILPFIDTYRDIRRWSNNQLGLNTPQKYGPQIDEVDNDSLTSSDPTKSYATQYQGI